MTVFEQGSSDSTFFHYADNFSVPVPGLYTLRATLGAPTFLRHGEADQQPALTQAGTVECTGRRIDTGELNTRVRALAAQRDRRESHGRAGGRDTAERGLRPLPLRGAHAAFERHGLPPALPPHLNHMVGVGLTITPITE